MQNAEDLHLVADDSIKQNIRMNKSASQIIGNLGTGSAEFRELAQEKDFFSELISISVSNRRVDLIEVGEDMVEI